MSLGVKYERCASITDTAADLLARGEVVSWFQGRMEFGPRALGNRSILGNPASRGTADMINAQIKYRERWRPFCPSMLDTVAPDILQTNHPTPYMTFTFDVAEHWKSRIPEVVHEDGTARPQIVTARSNPRYYELLQKFEAAMRGHLPAHQVKAIMAAVKDPAQLDAMPLNHFLGFFTL